MWELVKTKRYPALDTYSGSYDAVIVEFKTGPEQLPFMDQLGQWLADRVPTEAAKKGVTPLWLTVHRDIEPTWVTLWSVQFWGYGSPIPPLILAGIIAAVLVIFGVSIFGWLIVKEFSGVWQATPQELEREKEREQFVERLITEHNVSPVDALDILQGTKAPPQGVEVPDILKEAALPAIGVGVGILVLLGLVAFATTRQK